jgi:hypothetical protein
MIQHSFACDNGPIDPLQRLNYLRMRGSGPVTRQRLVCSVHSMKKELRQTIIINGKGTASLDVTATHPQLLFHKYLKQPMDYDPYAIVKKAHPDFEPLRNAAKLALMMMLNTISRKAAAAAFRKKLKEQECRKMRVAIAGLTESQTKILDMVWDLNPLLQPYFYKMKCYELMHMEGNIMWDFMRQMEERNIPTLTVHDECIFPTASILTALAVFKKCWVNETEIGDMNITPNFIISHPNRGESKV